MSSSPVRMALSILATCVVAPAVETENLDIRVLPSPGAVVVDGDWKDWDLSGGILACGDAKTQRDRFSVWVHLMYDADNLHILARWRDETPMNNPGSTKGDMGFLGDSLQFRTIWAYGDKDAEVVAHWTAWRDRDGLDLIDVAYGITFKDGKIRDAQDQGARQAFTVAPDGNGYIQEMSIPWSLVNRGKPAPKVGDSFRFTVEPNFLVSGGARLTIKDIFRAGVPIDRIFTFRGFNFWGAARLEPAGKVEPQKVRLSDGREFAVTMRDGLPVVDWTGLIERRDLTGFEDLTFDVPADGYVTVVVRDAAGQVVRHLLNGAFFTKGKQTVKWDGLSTPWLRNPGKPVEAGQYTWEGLFNPGLKLVFRGWACNDGKAPWDADATANWGGDHGPPTECHFDGKRMYLGWEAAEAGKALLCVDLDGKVQWRHVRGGIGGAQLIAVAGGHVFYRDDRAVVKLDAKSGGYVAWEGRADAALDGASILPPGSDGIAGLAAVGSKLYVSANKLDAICELESSSGALVRTFTVPKPGRLAADGGRLLVVSGGERLLAVALADGAVTTLASGFAQAKAVTVDPAGGRLLVSTKDPDHQIVVLDRAGKELSRLGVKGGRPERGPWQPERLRNPEGLAVDAKGRLWIAESTITPRRFSIWNLADGSFIRDLLGPTHYGASGSTTWSKDPNVLIGEGCEWRLDPQTGRATIAGTFDDDISSFARMHDPGNGRTYLTTSHDRGALLKVFERVAPGDWKLRATLWNGRVDQRTMQRVEDLKALLWSDVNGDEVQQTEEVAVLPYPVSLAGYTGWSHFTAPDLSLNVTASRFISGDPAKPKAPKAKETFVLHIPRAGFTACGAPLWNIAGAIARPIPNAAGLDSLDGKTMCRWLENAVECFTVDGNRLWSYPNTFSGVHGSHRATAPEPGILRGAFGIIGTARLPTLGNIWALNGNCGEWYLMSERYGFVSQLFQGDPMRFVWPDKAVPGVLMDSVPPGMGAEDFGGTLVQGADGKVYLTAGKTGIWSLEVTGFDGIRPISGGALTIEPAELPLAQAEYERQRQAAAIGKRLMIKRLAAAPTFTGDPKDLKELGATPAEYSKQESAAVKTALAYDDTKLYLHFEVRDDSPWVNGADAAPYLYARGDTVDFQIGTDPGLNPKRSEAGRGDLRLSIGSFKGKPTAVLYRRIADQAKPMTFSSGVVKAYEMQSVTVLEDAEIVVKPNPTQRRYVVQAAIPLATLGLAPKAGLVLRGDVGVTHGDLTGNDTALRTYWSNQMTGLVSDEVFELEMKPENWSDLAFE